MCLRLFSKYCEVRLPSNILTNMYGDWLSNEPGVFKIELLLVVACPCQKDLL